MNKLLLLAAVAMVLISVAVNAQVKTFPYFYNWTSPAQFAKQSDGRTYIGGDSNWYTYIVGNKSQWASSSTAVHTNNNNTADTLMVLVDATGLPFVGGETFSFVAARAGGPGPTGTMTITAGTNSIVEQVATDLSTSNLAFSVTLPAGLGNSVFSVYIIVNSNKQVSVDSTSISGGALPIELASFSATAINSRAVTLTWTTISEVNNYGFYVQRDGADIAFVAGHGTTLQGRTYSYTDNPLRGEHNYRLKQVDLDRTLTFSESILVHVNAPSDFSLAQNYPEPFNPSTTIKFELPRTSHVTVSVYDILGREVATLVNEVKEPGTYSVQFDGSNLASGAYFYQLKAGTFVETKKLLLLR